MTKNDFLDKLRLALNGKVSASLVQENMTYYSEYIDAQIRMGRSEQEVLDMLGDPRLIARTIVETNGTESVDERSYSDRTSYDDASYGGVENDTVHSQRSHYDNYQGHGNELKVRTLPGWLWTIIVVLIIICLISLVFSVISFLLPIVLPVLVILFFVKLFRDWLN